MGRFGSSVAHAGDLDLDSFDDLLVGAPYEGPTGAGRVYVFRGSPDGLEEKPSQVLEGKDNGLMTFGFSLSKGVDVDDNNYPDVIIGAPESAKVAYFRTRVVINMDSSVEIERSGKRVNMENRTCTLRLPPSSSFNADGASSEVHVVCFTFQSCLHYSGINVDAERSFRLRHELDPKKVNKRLFFMEEPETSDHSEVVTLKKGVQDCKRHLVYLMVSIQGGTFETWHHATSTKSISVIFRPFFHF